MSLRLSGGEASEIFNMFPTMLNCSTSPEKSSENTNSFVRIPIVDLERWQRLSGNISNIGLIYNTMCSVTFEIVYSIYNKENFSSDDLILISNNILQKYYLYNNIKTICT